MPQSERRRIADFPVLSDHTVGQGRLRRLNPGSICHWCVVCQDAPGCECLMASLLSLCPTEAPRGRAQGGGAPVFGRIQWTALLVLIPLSGGLLWLLLLHAASSELLSSL